MNFVGRAEIIESIQSRIAMNQMSLCVVYGPHRSGKSYVASQLVRRHKALYLAGRMANEAIHVADMNRALEARFVPADGQDKFEPITTLQEAFEGLFESSVKTPQTVVIDDYPSLVEAVPQFPIHLRDLLDAYKETSHLNIILMANGLETARWPHHWRSQLDWSLCFGILRGETVLLGGHEILGPSLCQG